MNEDNSPSEKRETYHGFKQYQRMVNSGELQIGDRIVLSDGGWRYTVIDDLNLGPGRVPSKARKRLRGKEWYIDNSADREQTDKEFPYQF